MNHTSGIYDIVILFKVIGMCFCSGDSPRINNLCVLRCTLFHVFPGNLTVRKHSVVKLGLSGKIMWSHRTETFFFSRVFFFKYFWLATWWSSVVAYKIWVDSFHRGVPARLNH